jgi:hypothetical protein
MKPVSPAGATLKKSFSSPFIHRKLYANQRPGGRSRHTGFQARVTALPKWKVSSKSVQSHPRSRQIGSHLIRRGLAFARVQPTGFGRDTPYSSSKRGFCVRKIVAEKPQSIRANGRADVRSHGQSVADPGPCPVRNRVMSASSPQSRTVHDRIQSVSLNNPKP